MPFDEQSSSIWRRLIATAGMLSIVTSAAVPVIAQPPSPARVEQRAPAPTPELRDKVNELVEEILESNWK